MRHVVGREELHDWLPLRRVVPCTGLHCAAWRRIADLNVAQNSFAISYHRARLYPSFPVSFQFLFDQPFTHGIALEHHGRGKNPESNMCAIYRISKLWHDYIFSVIDSRLAYLLQPCSVHIDLYLAPPSTHGITKTYRRGMQSGASNTASLPLLQRKRWKISICGCRSFLCDFFQTRWS